MEFGLRPMHRNLPKINTKYKSHSVESVSTINDRTGLNGGLTFSSEDSNDAKAASLEFEVLRCIISREAYLEKLHLVARTVAKLFKPEIADLLDLIRMASLDVIENIEKWRRAKNDKDAVFIWNGLNYIAKMPSDLDFLSQYPAIIKWLSYSIERNPFCIPFPLQPNQFSDEVIDPKHIETGAGLTEGYNLTIGSNFLQSNKSSQKEDKIILNSSPYKSSKNINSSKFKSTRRTESTDFAFSHYILNDDMKRIRRAEEIILYEESKHGALSRDPEGRLVPLEQALMRKVIVELKKDDKRPISEPSQTSLLYAPHAARSDVGIAEASWTPDLAKSEAPVEDEKSQDEVKDFRLLKLDHMNEQKRGMSMSGGSLGKFEPKGSSSRQRKPIKASVTSSMDFKRSKQIKTLAERLNEIESLKAAIKLANSKKPLNLEINSNSLVASRGSLSYQRIGILATNNSMHTSSSLSVQQSSVDANRGYSTKPVEKNDSRIPESSLSKSLVDIVNLDINDSISKNDKCMEIEASKLQRHLLHYSRDHEALTDLKELERAQRNHERSRDIERKRRLLTYEEGLRKGPPPEDDSNVYDFYAIRVQSTIRGWLVRCWVRWYRNISNKACITIQSILRGWLGRLRVRNIRKRYRSAVLIQKNFRGWNTRGTSAAFAKEQGLIKKAVAIQRIWRGILGRRRAVSKRALDAAAREAFDAVDARSLVASDVKELGRRIQYAIEEPGATTFPPDEVLHLVRLTTFIIQSARGNLGISSYNFFNSRDYDEYSGEEFDWRLASKMLNRSERFIRLIRAVAFGPGAKPPRLIQLSEAGNKLYTAQAKNPNWNLTTFEGIGLGSRICCQLFKWITSMIEVATRQQEFLSLIAESFPDWLPKLHKLQQDLREYEFEIELNNKCLLILQEHASSKESDQEYSEISEKEIKFVKRALSDTKKSLKDNLAEIDKLKTDQMSKEAVVLNTMQEKVDESTRILEDLIKLFKDTSELAKNGDRAAIEKLPEVRHNLTNQRLKTSELDSQRKVLELQIESNKLKRKDPARLDPDIVLKAILAGEAKAAYIIAQIDTKAMLVAAGVKHPTDLPLHLADIYDELYRKEDCLRSEARRRFVDADRERVAHDEMLSRSSTAHETKEKKSKDKMLPTEEELEEERIEDEKEAVLERIKHMQFISDSVLFEQPKAPRPILIALSHDLPAYVKRKIYIDLVQQMPGSFIYTESKINLGLDIEALQAILNAGKNIVVCVDHGLTRLTRDSFVNLLELTIQALYPSPIVALAVGDEKNCRIDSQLMNCGVDPTSMDLFRDYRIKHCLEWIIRLSYKLLEVELRNISVSRSREKIPNSKSFGCVVEAIFVIFNEKKLRLPEKNMSAMTWQLTRHMLAEPINIAIAMMSLRRGSASLEQVSCLQQYTQNSFWPVIGTKDRTDDLLCDIFATFVELFIELELLCIQGGGVPLQSLTKSSIKGIHTVVTVCDALIDLPSHSGIPDGLFTKIRVDFRQASSLLIRASIQDLKILKSVRKISGDIYSISVYRHCSRVFFEAYDSATSEIYLTSIDVVDIPSLLAPSGNDPEEKKVAPATSMDMYERLLKLLRFEYKRESSTFKEKRLVCKRDFTFLHSSIRRIDGYQVIVKCFEAAVGELYFSGYIPERAISISTTLSSVERLSLTRHADKETDEWDLSKLEDPRPMLPYVLDRLRIFPSKRMLMNRLLGGIDIDDMLLSENTVTLRAKTTGRIGKILLCQAIQIFGVRFIMEIRESTPLKLLEVSVYDQLSQMTLRIRISKFERRLLLGSDSEDYHKWIDKLKNRIRIDWHGEAQLYFDTKLVQKAVLISDIRFALSIFVSGKDSVKVVLSVNSSSKSFSGIMTVSMMLELIGSKTNMEMASAISKRTIDNLRVNEVVRDMKSPNEMNENSKHPNIHPSESSMLLLEDVMLNKDFLNIFIERLTSFLVFSNPHDLSDGLHVKNCSIAFKLTQDVSLSGNCKLPINDKLRFLKYTRKLKTSSGDLSSLLCTRKQPPIVILETELDRLAIERSRQAEIKKKMDNDAALSLEEHLQTLNEEALSSAISDGSNAAKDFILDEITSQLIDRFKERDNPGYHQTLLEINNPDDISQPVENALLASKVDNEAVIFKNSWQFVLELGVKATFREGKVKWNGHVSVKVFEDICWTAEFGLGRRYKFVVYEPNVAASFEGFVRSNKHLVEILGVNGQDLLNPIKSKEMIIFICRYRLEVVVNKKTWDGEELDNNAPVYRIEFQSERLFSNDKITPVNAGADEDEEANSKKLLEIENARGKKLLRLVRRVSGLLMQITVFELPSAVAEAAMAANPLPEFMNDGDDSSSGSSPNRETGYAENRKEVLTVKKFPPPAFRIVAYDPRSKRKVTLGVEPQAIIEVSGGIYSPYLDPARRKELAKVVCETLILFFPSGRPFEIVVPWSGAKHSLTTAEIEKDSKKLSMRSSAERINRRSGRLFRSAMKISKYELIVSLYANSILHGQAPQLIFNFYSPAASGAVELAVTEEEQIERIGRPILSFSEGSVRATAIRHFCNFFGAEIVIDILDPSIRTLHVVLRSPSKEFITDYQNCGVPYPGDDLRPVGIPSVFSPLDTCGRPIHRRGMTLSNRDKNSALKNKEFLVTLYTKSMNENPERGFVVKLYDRSTSFTAVLHIGASELIRICNFVDEPELLNDIVKAEEDERSMNNDYIEDRLAEFTEKGVLSKKTRELVEILVNVVLNDLGFFESAQGTIVPYIKSSPKGIMPELES